MILRLVRRRILGAAFSRLGSAPTAESLLGINLSRHDAAAHPRDHFLLGWPLEWVPIVLIVSCRSCSPRAEAARSVGLPPWWRCVCRPNGFTAGSCRRTSPRVVPLALKAIYAGMMQSW